MSDSHNKTGRDDRSASGPQQGEADASGRSAVAVALEWSSTVITLCMAMVVPGLIGYWLDGWLGTGFVFLLLGMAIGVPVGIWMLIRVVQSKSPAARDEQPRR